MFEFTEIFEILKTLLGISFIFYLISLFTPSANFQKLISAITVLVTFFMIFSLVSFYIYHLFYADYIYFKYILSMPIFIILIFLLLLILVLACIPSLINTIRIISFYLHKDKVFANGYKDVGTIIDIKREYPRRSYKSNYLTCYLIVEYNGKKLKSMYFFEDKSSEPNSSYFSKYCKTFNIGDNIDIMVYGKYQYVILDEIKNSL